jgi:hypothetical protein
MLHRHSQNAICKLGLLIVESGVGEANNSSNTLTFVQNACCDKCKPILVRNAEPQVWHRLDQERETGFGPGKLLARFNGAVLDRFDICESQF